MSSNTASTSQQTQSQDKPQLDVCLVWSGRGKWAFGLGAQGSCTHPDEETAAFVVYGPAFTPGKVDEEYPLRVTENCPNRPEPRVYAKICNIDADKRNDFKTTILAFHPNVESFRVEANKSPLVFMVHAWDYVYRQGVLDKSQYNDGREAFCKCVSETAEAHNARSLARENGGTIRRRGRSPQRWREESRRIYP
ncbi:hypothetical protein J3459_017540 [Metarhizium acridum]|nr:hypothetical protein J3459_017540 [Metarhizium acridum]